VPRLFASHDDRDLVRAERDVRLAFTGLDLDLRALAAVSNIFRAATAVRNHMESRILEQHELSWSAFTTVFVLRVWGEMDARSLANEAGVTAATLTGVMKTLEGRQLLKRRSDRDDGRRVMVSLTAKGKKAVDEIMPAFNRHEAMVTQALTETELDDLARSLRVILRTVDAVDL
jgi:MarR family transcriptional regulator, organic hydroperoxide resistance regulator